MVRRHLGTGKLLYRSTVFIKQVTVGNDLFIVLRLSPTVSISVITPSSPDTPAAPSLTSPSPQAITVEWITPNDNGSDITKYDIRYREDGTSSWTTVLGQRGLQYTITGLDAMTEYEVRVRAVNSEGTSAWSNITTQETTPEFEFDTGVLFILEGGGGSNITIWRLNNIQSPGTATELYTLTYQFVRALAFDDTGLLFISRSDLHILLSYIESLISPQLLQQLLN